MIADTHMITDNLVKLRAKIKLAADHAGRAPGAVRLMAVSKTQPVAALEAAIAAGQRLFGENKVQEAAEKWPALRARSPDIELHLIGPLQSNKARQAAGLFDVVESLDREKLARAFARILAEEKRQLRFYIQVNTGEEPQKAGIAPHELGGFLHLCRDELKLDVVGLMCIPPVGDHPGPHFGLLAKLAAKYGLKELSMGMSGDYEAGVLCGATLVRLGSAIFGARPA